MLSYGGGADIKVRMARLELSGAGGGLARKNGHLPLMCCCLLLLIMMMIMMMMMMMMMIMMMMMMMMMMSITVLLILLHFICWSDDW